MYWLLILKKILYAEIYSNYIIPDYETVQNREKLQMCNINIYLHLHTIM
jgi:hypothetical protein